MRVIRIDPGALNVEMKKAIDFLKRNWPWAVMLLVLAFLYYRANPGIDLSDSYGQAPDFEVATLGGETFHLSEHRGKVVVLNFWATWCPPCRMEIPGFIDLQDEYGDDVVFVGLALDQDDDSAVREYADEKGINYPVIPGAHAVARSYGGIASLPTTFVVDPRGEIRFKHEGLLLTGNLRSGLDALLRGS